MGNVEPVGAEEIGFLVNVREGLCMNEDSFDWRTGEV